MSALVRVIDKRTGDDDELTLALKTSICRSAELNGLITPPICLALCPVFLRVEMHVADRLAVSGVATPTLRWNNELNRTVQVLVVVPINEPAYPGARAV